MSKPIEAILQRDMTRKEFLATLGFGIASIFGFSNVLRLLTGKSLEDTLHKNVSAGYGSSAYGGSK